MEVNKVSVAEKKIDNSSTLLDFLNVFYKDKRIKPVRNTTSFFNNVKVMEGFWDWLDAQEIQSDKIKFLIANIGVEKQKHLSSNPLINVNFNDKKDEHYDYGVNTIDYCNEDEEVYKYK